jgi:hypothetical protein
MAEDIFIHFLNYEYLKFIQVCFLHQDNLYFVAKVFQKVVRHQSFLS